MTFVIYRAESDNQAHTAVNDKIIAETSQTKLVRFRPILTRFSTDNPSPFEDETFKPDTGFSGNRYEIHLMFDESLGTTNARLAGGITTLRNWFRERNTQRQDLRYGRIGIYNNYRPEFNLKPRADSGSTKGAGFKLLHFEINQEMEYLTLPLAFLILEFSGNPTHLGNAE